MTSSVSSNHPAQRPTPVRDRLEEALRNRISGGEFSPGDFFPSIRTLASEYQCSPRTVGLALRNLCRENLLCCERNYGFRIPDDSEIRPRILLYIRPTRTGHNLAITQGAVQRLKERNFPYDLLELEAPIKNFSEIASRYRAVLSIRYVDRDEHLRHDTILQHGLLHVIANLEEGQKKYFGSYVNRYTLTCRTISMLYDMGHRNIAIMTGNPEQYFFPDMCQAYLDTMAKLRLPIRSGYMAVMKQNFELGAYLCTRELLALPVVPSVIVTGRDFQASGIYQACIDNQLRPGKDVSIVGYDNIGWEEGNEFLTTYQEPVLELGIAAADITCDLLQGRDRPKRRELVPELIMRQSLCPILRAPLP